MAAVLVLALLWWLFRTGPGGADPADAPCPPGTAPCVLAEGPPTCCPLETDRETAVLDRLRGRA